MEAAQALYFGPDGRRLYGVLHPPAASARPVNQGWLFLAAWGEERDTAGRVVCELAEALAARGYWCLRYDPAGNGNSQGDFADVTAEDHLRDLPLAVAELEARAGVPCGGLFGLRCGASLAVRARAHYGWELPLVLWEPLPEGARYAEELLRTVMATRLAARAEQVTREDLRRELAAGDRLAVRGHALTQAGLDALQAVDLLNEPLAGQGPSLVIQIDRRPGRKPRPALERLVARLGACGETRFVQAHGPLPWVLTNTEYDVRPPALFGPTLDWVDAHAADRVPLAPSLPAADVATGERHPERTVAIRLEGHVIRGILHEPTTREPGAPLVVMPVTSALFQVRLARTLGAIGWASLRFDPRGKGDSDGHLDYSTVAQMHFAVQSGLLQLDLDAVVRFATDALGYRGTIPVGICGDAVTAVFHAANAPGVLGLAPLELPLLTTHQRKRECPSSRLRHLLAARVFARGTRRGEQVRRFLYRAQWVYRGAWEMARRLATRDRNTSLAHTIAGRLGERANEPLVAALAGCVERRLPMLLLYGSQRMDGPSGFDRVLPLLEKAHAEGARRIRHRLIDGADHHFSTPEHSEEARREIIAWLTSPGQPWNGASSP
jgi:alpha/beta superfamily hydrolase